MTTQGQEEGTVLQGPFWLLCGLLLLVACAEWLAFYQQQVWGLAPKYLVPAMLVLAVAKFAAVIAWLIGKVPEVSPWQKLVLFLSVVNGSALICLLLLARG